MNLSRQINVIPDDLAGLRLDQALAHLFPQHSRSRLKEWLLEDIIIVQGGPKRPKDIVSGGEIVEIKPQKKETTKNQAQPIMLDIVYEDEELIVLNKPAGLVVHPGAGNPDNTLMNGLLFKYSELKEVPRAGIIHRLDKDTSGLMVVAKNLISHTALLRLFEKRKISRHYVAVCNGALTGGGTINLPISRHPIDRKKMSVQGSGREAITHFTIKERFASFTYISVKLETGRTHQIRVHFAHRRNALVGDQTYGKRLSIPRNASEELIQILRHFKRQALHAERLVFNHPLTDKTIDIKVSPPKDFIKLVEVMRRDLIND